MFFTQLSTGGTAGGFRWFASYEEYENAKESIRSSILKIFQYTMNGELVNVYDSYVDAERTNKISKGNINRAVNRNKDMLLSAGGYIWTTTRVPKTQLLNDLRSEHNKT